MLKTESINYNVRFKVQKMKISRFKQKTIRAYTFLRSMHGFFEYLQEPGNRAGAIGVIGDHLHLRPRG